MADDLKISEMVELLAGGIHDDLLFEIVDLTEAEPADQNKRVKLSTLASGAFGEEDVIFNGDTEVRCLAAGITADVDTLNVLDFTQTNQRIGVSGDTYTEHIQSGAPDGLIRSYIDGSLRLSQSANETIIGDEFGIGLFVSQSGNINIQVAGAVNVGAFNATVQRIGESTDTSIEVNRSADTIVLDIAGTPNLSIGSTGIQLAAGATVNDIETTLTDDDTHLPTSGAVFDAIAAISTNSIEQLDTKVEVTDTGTDGKVVADVDGTEVLNFRRPGGILFLTIGDANDRIIWSGVDDEIYFDVGGSKKFSIKDAGQGYVLGAGAEGKITGKAAGIDFEDGSGDNIFRLGDSLRGVGVYIGRPGFFIGDGKGLLTIIGDGSDPGDDDGGGVRLELSALHDTTIDYFQIRPFEDDLLIGPDTDLDSLKYRGNDGVWQFTGSGGIALAAGAAVNDIETTLTDDDTHLPTSGAVFDAIGAINNLANIADAIGGLQITDGASDTADLLFDGSGNLAVNNLTDGGKITLNTQNFSSPERIISGYEANGGAIIYHADNESVVTQTYGVDIKAGGGATMEIRFAGSDLEIINRQHGNLLSLKGENAGGTLQTIFEGDPDGAADTYAAGVLKQKVTADGLELKGDQTGAQAIGSGVASIAVTFGTAHADAAYQVLVTMENTVDAGPLFLVPCVTAKATTGFTVSLSASTPTANYVLNWMVLRS